MRTHATRLKNASLRTGDSPKSRHHKSDDGFADHRPQATMQKKMQEAADASSAIKQLRSIPRMANLSSSTSSKAVAQMIFIGEARRHHMHVGPGIHQPHYKDGNGDRINIGANQHYTKAKMEEVIDHLKTQTDQAGAQDCLDWCLAECRRIKAEQKAAA